MTKDLVIITLEIPKGKHYKSTDTLYNGGFVQLTECSDCGAVQDYFSNNSSVCEYCGGVLAKKGTGKWDNKQKQWLRRQVT